MPQYVVKLQHTSDQCPSANSKVRERVTRGAQELPRLAEKLHVRFLAGPLVLAVEHEAIAVVESDSEAAVHELVLHSGLMQWNTVRVSPARKLEDVTKEFEKFPPPLY